MTNHEQIQEEELTRALERGAQVLHDAVQSVHYISGWLSEEKKDLVFKHITKPLYFDEFMDIFRQTFSELDAEVEKYLTGMADITKLAETFIRRMEKKNLGVYTASVIIPQFRENLRRLFLAAVEFKRMTGPDAVLMQAFLGTASSPPDNT